MRASRWLLTGLLIGSFALVGDTHPAHAQLEGPCDASGSWQDTDLVVDAATVGDEVVTIPRKDTVAWQGSVGGAPGDYTGSVSIDLPPPFGSFEVDSWSGNSDTTSNSGEKEYTLPKFVPAGVTFQVSGHHYDDNGECVGYVNIEIKGGAFDSPVTYVALALTILFGGLLGAALVPILQGIVKSGIRSV